MSPRYTPTLLDHFTNPRHVGMLEDADATGQGGGGPLCPEDMANVWIRVRDGRIAQIRHKTMGCPVAIASSSVTCELAVGKTLDEALAITPEVVIAALGGVPERKADSVVAPEALRQAIAAYRASL
jgi:nitrogen fixation NifU-like protein